MKEQNLSTQSLAMIGMLTAVLAVLSIVQIPMPSGVPITLQTFAVALCGYILGSKRGVLCIVLYLLLGFVGLPVFTGMTGGIGKLFGFTGGFLYGFLFLALFCGLGLRLPNTVLAFLAGAAGLILCHIAGALHYAAVADCGIGQSFLLVSVPYLIKDLLSVAGACVAARIVRKTMNRAAIGV